MNEMIKHRFNGWINWKFVSKPEIARFLVDHERAHLCINNICSQLETIILKRPNTTLKTMAEIIDSTAKMFCQAAMQEREEYLMTRAGRIKLQDEAGKIDDLEAEQKELKKEFDPTNTTTKIFMTGNS